MSAMVNLEVPWINIMSKMDLISTRSKDPVSGRNGLRTRRDISRYVPTAVVSLPRANYLADILIQTRF
jgi:GPN-loop GTPase